AIEANLGGLRAVAASPAFVTGKVSTRALAEVSHRPKTLTVLSGGPATSVQDYPGRLGYWDVGVPPSGPMDALAFRLGNRLLGNDEGAAGLEITGVGPTLVYNAPAIACLAGAELEASLDGTPVAPYEPFDIAAGQTLKL